MPAFFFLFTLCPPPLLSPAALTNRDTDVPRAVPHGERVDRSEGPPAASQAHPVPHALQPREEPARRAEGPPVFFFEFVRSSSDAALQNQAIRYLEYCVTKLGNTDTAIHNYLLSLYPISFLFFLHMWRFCGRLCVSTYAPLPLFVCTSVRSPTHSLFVLFCHLQAMFPYFCTSAKLTLC